MAKAVVVQTLPTRVTDTTPQMPNPSDPKPEPKEICTRTRDGLRMRTTATFSSESTETKGEGHNLLQIKRSPLRILSLAQTDFGAEGGGRGPVRGEQGLPADLALRGASLPPHGAQSTHPVHADRGSRMAGRFRHPKESSPGQGDGGTRAALETAHDAVLPHSTARMGRGGCCKHPDGRGPDGPRRGANYGRALGVELATVTAPCVSRTSESQSKSSQGSGPSGRPGAPPHVQRGVNANATLSLPNCQSWGDYLVFCENKIPWATKGSKRERELHATTPHRCENPWKYWGPALPDSQP